MQVSLEILAKYAGTYEEQDFWGTGPHPRMIEVTVSDGKLIADLKGRRKAELVAQSQTLFQGFWGWGISFVADSQGIPTHLLGDACVRQLQVPAKELGRGKDAGARALR